MGSRQVIDPERLIQHARIQADLEGALFLLRDAASGYLAVCSDEDYPQHYDSAAVHAFVRVSDAIGACINARDLVATIGAVEVVE